MTQLRPVDSQKTCSEQETGRDDELRSFQPLPPKLGTSPISLQETWLLHTAAIPRFRQAIQMAVELTAKDRPPDLLEIPSLAKSDLLLPRLDAF